MSKTNKVYTHLSFCRNNHLKKSAYMMNNMRNKLTPKTLTIREVGQKKPLNVRTLNIDTFSNRDMWWRRETLMRNKTLENCQDVKRNVFQERTQNYEKKKWCKNMNYNKKNNNNIKNTGKRQTLDTWYVLSHVVFLCSFRHRSTTVIWSLQSSSKLYTPPN